MDLATDLTDYAEGSLGLVELAASYLNDRTHKFWSKGELVAYVNEAQWTIAAEINRIAKEYFLTSATTPLVAGQAYYSMPSDLIKLSGLEIADSSSDRDPQDIQSVALQDRKFYEVLQQAQNKADYRFFFVAGTTFRLMPEAGTVNGQLARCHYVKRLSRLTLNSDVSEIPEQHHGLIAMDAARLAFVKGKQQNPQLERMRAERLEAMMAEIRVYIPMQEDRVEPFYGSFGPPETISDLIL